MPHIDSTKFGEIIIDGKKYNQVLIISDAIYERDYNKLERLFGTSHKIGDWEAEMLIKNKPSLIVIGTEQDGYLSVEENFFQKIREANIQVYINCTPQAIQKYNRETVRQKVNALIHTTC